MEIRVFDNGGKTLDRYTVVFESLEGNGLYEALAMGNNLQGFCQHTSAYLHSFRSKSHQHLGKEISISDLPESHQKFIEREVKAYG